jgi:uncharacterized membrane protein
MTSVNREVKNYYATDKLNRGYKMEDEKAVLKEEVANSSPKLEKKYEFLLPPTEVIAEYEALYPGALERIIKIAEKEQQKKHETEKAILSSNEISRRIGGLFGVLAIAIISSTSFQIASIDLFTSIIFSAIAFGSIFGVSLISYLRMNTGYRGNNRYQNNRFKGPYKEGFKDSASKNEKYSTSSADKAFDEKPNFSDKKKFFKSKRRKF